MFKKINDSYTSILSQTLLQNYHDAAITAIISIFLLHNYLHMSNTSLLSGIIFIVVFLSTPNLHATGSGKYPIRNFAPTDYQAGIQNIDFAQNRDMNLFVANNLGVLSYNGSEWKVYAYNTGLKQRSLAFDPIDDRLYVGSQGDFGYFEDEWTYISLLERIPADFRDFDEVWDVYIINSAVYFCTFQNIYVYDGQDISIISLDGGFNRSFLAGSQLFTQDSNGNLFKIDDVNSFSKSLVQGQSNQVVAGIIPEKSGYLVFYNSGRIEYSTTEDAVEVYPILSEALRNTYVNHVDQLSDGRLVISTQVAGVFLFDPETEIFENISSETGLISNDCLRTFQDHSGNLWIGMQNGIALVDINSPIRVKDENINLNGSGYEAYETPEGTYFTTSNGIYFQKENEAKCTFIVGTEGPAYGMRSIGNALYAGHHTGLFLLSKGTARRCARTDGLWDIKQLHSNPDYAIGGTYAGLYLFKKDNDGVYHGVRDITGFSESSRFFEEDSNGIIWVGQYYKGLYQLELNKSLEKVTVRKPPSAFSSMLGKHIILTRIDNELYLASDQGIFRVDPNDNSIEREKKFAGIVGNSWVYLLAQDRKKNVFIFTDNLVGFFKRVSTNNYIFVPSSLYQLSPSFNNDLLHVSVNARYGIYLNANNGFIQYSPSLEEQLGVELKPLIRRIYSSSEDSIVYHRSAFQPRIDSIAPVSMLEGVKKLRLDIESFQFRNTNNPKFRYFLEGFDSHYGDWTNSTTKEYTNLQAGDYIFHVQTLNHLGELVGNTPVAIRVRPPFYNSSAARILYLVVLVGLITLIYLGQKRHFRTRQHTLEKHRKQEIEAKQEELQQLKDDKIQSELRHVNNLLAASTMNLVVKNEFMENIKQQIEHVKLSEQHEDVARSLERIAKEIDTTLKVQEDWEQFEYHFDKVHGDFLSRLTTEFTDLTPGEQKLCAFLRLNMDTKEIANLMGISLRGVEVARYRLRKKLRLSQNQNLSKYILEY